MNGTNEERFFSLAMKMIGGQATDAERTELDAALANDRELRAEFDRLREEVAVAKEILPLVAATQSTAGELPGYAQERLQSKVRRSLGTPTLVEKKAMTFGWDWRWLLVLAPVAALFVLLLWPAAPAATVIQVAMLDTAGATRGGDDKETATLKETWPNSRAEVFASTNQLEGWERIWPNSGKASAVKIIFDRSAGEVRVIGHKRGGTFGKTFQVGADLGSTLKIVESYVAGEMVR